MKITRKDLDSAILEKIDSLDNVLKTYDEKHPDGFVSYGPNGFYFKKTNDTFLKKVYDESEIVSLEESLYKGGKNISSTMKKDLRSDKKANTATKSFIFNTPFTHKKDLGSKITHYKELNNTLYLLTVDGVFHKVDNGDTINIELIKILGDNFNLAKKLYPADIVDFDIIDNDNIVLGTSNFGVYKFCISKKEAELLFVVENLREIKVTYIKTLFVMTDDFCAQYDLTSGHRIEKYSNLLNRRQLPLDAVRVDGDIFVLGAPVGIFNLDNVLHLWKLDDAKVAYNSADSRIEKFHLDNRYHIMFIAYDDNYIYLSGLFENNPFILNIDRKTLRVCKLKVFKDLDLEEYTDFRAIDGQFFVLSRDMLYILDMNCVEERLQLEAPCSRVKVFNGEVVATSDKYLVKFQLTKFSSSVDTLSYKVLENEEPCNNLDILIKGVSRAERVTLIDGDTKREIPPSYYVLYKGNAIIKLMNCRSTNIIMNISVTQTSNIEGIVVRKNRIFLR